MLERANPNDWAFNDKLTSSQINFIDAQLPRAIDGGGSGGEYAPSAAIVIGGAGLKLADANHLVTGTLSVASGGIFRLLSGSAGIVAAGAALTIATSGSLAIAGTATVAVGGELDVLGSLVVGSTGGIEVQSAASLVIDDGAQLGIAGAAALLSGGTLALAGGSTTTAAGALTFASGNTIDGTPTFVGTSVTHFQSGAKIAGVLTGDPASSGGSPILAGPWRVTGTMQCVGPGRVMRTHILGPDEGASGSPHTFTIADASVISAETITADRTWDFSTAGMLPNDAVVFTIGNVVAGHSVALLVDGASFATLGRGVGEYMSIELWWDGTQIRVGQIAGTWEA